MSDLIPKKDILDEQRTTQQNKALHLFFRFIAQELNDSGQDMRMVLKPDVEIPWTPENVKNHIWRPIQKIYLQKKSTTELNKLNDIDQVYEIVNRHLSEKCHLHIPFPSLDSILEKYEPTRNN